MKWVTRHLNKAAFDAAKSNMIEGIHLASIKEYNPGDEHVWSFKIKTSEEELEPEPIGPITPVVPVNPSGDNR